MSKIFVVFFGKLMSLWF